MKNGIRFACVAAALLPLVGCSALLGFLSQDTATVRLVNNGSFPVQVELYVGNDQNALELTLTAFGEKLEFTIQPGETASFSRDCDDLQAIVISKADLMIVGGIGPDQNTRVYRDGSDFGCGDALVFTFTHPALPTELNIAFARQQ